MHASCQRLTLGSAFLLWSALCPLHAGESIPPPSAGASVGTRGPTAPVAPTPATPWFIAEYVSVYTPLGMAGFEPGCPVRLVRRDEKLDRLTVTDGQYEVEVNSAQVTNDPAVGASLRARSHAEDEAARAAVAARRFARSKLALRVSHPTPAPTPLAIPPVPPKPFVPPVLQAAAPIPPPPARLPTLPSFPAGTLFLREYVSTRWERGVAGFAPGQPVQLLNADPATGRLTVTDGQYRVEVDSPQVTDDPALAAALWQHDTAEQRAALAAVREDSLARTTAQRRFEEAKQRIEFARDWAEAETILKMPHLSNVEGNGEWRHVMDHSYGMHGYPYSAAHQQVDMRPPVSKGNSSLGDFVDGFHF